MYSTATDRTTGVIADQTITLDGYYTSRDYPGIRKPQRRSCFLPIRWPYVPLAGRAFFKWIKQHLRIKQFYGISENAVKTQIWIAVSVYVLAAIVRKRLKLEVSLCHIDAGVFGDSI